MGTETACGPRSIRRRTLASAILTFAAGGLDALCFIALGDVFASVMTGNLVMLGLAAGSVDTEHVGAAAIALFGYIVAVVLTAAVSHRWRLFRPLHGLFLEVVLLVAFCVVWWSAVPPFRPVDRWVLLVLASTAMGVQSTTVLGRPHGPTTYMTGTLTRLLGAVPEPGSRTNRAAVTRVAMLVCGAACAAGVLQGAPRLGSIMPLLLVVTAVGTASRDPEWSARPRDRAQRQADGHRSD